MHRCFIDEELYVGKIVTLSGDEAKHIAQVLRLAKGDTVEICNDSGNVYPAQISAAEKGLVTLQITNVYVSENEPKTKVFLFQALSKGTKMDLVIQKATELGVSGVIPVATAFSVVRLQEESAKPKRWQKIALEAAKQCKRAVVPKVYAPVSFAEAKKMLAVYDKALIAYESEKTVSIKQALDGSFPTCGIMIGPEGGFSEEEIASLHDTLIRTVSLGKRILRTETAAITALSVIMYACGELG